METNCAIKLYLKQLESYRVCNDRPPVINGNHLAKIIEQSIATKQSIHFISIGRSPQENGQVSPIIKSRKKVQRFSEEVASFFKSLESLGTTYQLHIGISDAAMHSHNTQIITEVLCDKGVNAQGFSDYATLSDTLDNELTCWLNIDDATVKHVKLAQHIPLVTVFKNCGNWLMGAKAAQKFLTQKELLLQAMGVRVGDFRDHPQSEKKCVQKLKRLSTEQMQKLTEILFPNEKSANIKLIAQKMWELLELSS
ncbi:MAG: hypothetical protein LBG64_00210 [Pseudomonadales bacterium]|nr:hypothetical protein [Pseudomonadales bacterium]